MATKKNHSDIFITNESYIYLNTPDLPTRQALMCCLSCGTFFCAPNYITDRCNYPKFLLAYTVSGKGYLTYQNTNYTLTVGDLFMIDCVEYHRYQSDEKDPWVFEWIHFSGGNSYWYYNTFKNHSGVVIHLEKSNHIRKHIKTIFETMQVDLSPIKNILLNQHLIHIFAHLLTTNTTAFSSLNVACSNEKITTAISYIKEHYSETITVDMLAGTCSLSRYHFSRVFKSIMHATPHEYVILYRLTVAKQLLINSNATIESIAYHTGFTDASHFIRTFKHYESITPLTFKSIYAQS